MQDTTMVLNFPSQTSATKPPSIGKRYAVPEKINERAKKYRLQDGYNVVYCSAVK